MIKFVVLLTTAITFNFTLSFSDLIGLPQKENAQEIQLVFTENQIGVESGQPVYPLNTKVFVKALTEKELIVSVNGSKELKENGTEVDLSRFISANADTYTVIVEAKDGNSDIHKVFGFSTK